MPEATWQNNTISQALLPLQWLHSMSTHNGFYVLVTQHIDRSSAMLWWVPTSVVNCVHSLGASQQRHWQQRCCWMRAGLSVVLVGDFSSNQDLPVIQVVIQLVYPARVHPFVHVWCHCFIQLVCHNMTIWHDDSNTHLQSFYMLFDVYVFCEASHIDDRTLCTQ